MCNMLIDCCSVYFYISHHYHNGHNIITITGHTEQNTIYKWVSRNEGGHFYYTSSFSYHNIIPKDLGPIFQHTHLVLN